MQCGANLFTQWNERENLSLKSFFLSKNFSFFFLWRERGCCFFVSNCNHVKYTLTLKNITGYRDILADKRTKIIFKKLLLIIWLVRFLFVLVFIESGYYYIQFCFIFSTSPWKRRNMIHIDASARLQLFNYTDLCMATFSKWKITFFNIGKLGQWHPFIDYSVN